MFTDIPKCCFFFSFCRVQFLIGIFRKKIIILILNFEILRIDFLRSKKPSYIEDTLTHTQPHTHAHPHRTHTPARVCYHISSANASTSALRLNWYEVWGILGQVVSAPRELVANERRSRTLALKTSQTKWFSFFVVFFVLFSSVFMCFCVFSASAVVGVLNSEFKLGFVVSEFATGSPPGIPSWLTHHMRSRDVGCSASCCWYFLQTSE